MTDIIFRVVEVGGRDGAGTDGFVCVSVNLDLEKKTLKTFIFWIMIGCGPSCGTVLFGRRSL